MGEQNLPTEKHGVKLVGELILKEELVTVTPRCNLKDPRNINNINNLILVISN